TEAPLGYLPSEVEFRLEERSLRWQAILQSPRRRRAAVLGSAADAARAASTVAGAYRRADTTAAGARRRRRGRHLHRSLDLSDSDGGREHPDRPDVFPACRAAERARAAARSAAGCAVRRPAAHRDDPAESQPLRSLRSAYARQ